MTEVHLGGFGAQKTRRIVPYLVEQIDDRFYVGIRPDDMLWTTISGWCEDIVGDGDVDWGIEADELYSPLSSGIMIWFADEPSWVLFRMAWCL